MINLKQKQSSRKENNGAKDKRKYRDFSFQALIMNIIIWRVPSDQLNESPIFILFDEVGKIS